MTEIYATLGPACEQADILEKMFAEGMTGMRLNLSHSGLKESEALIQRFWQAAQHAGVRAELLIDLQGPEVRIGELYAPLLLQEAGKVMFVCQEQSGDASITSVRQGQKEIGSYDGRVPVAEQILIALEAGDHILLDDGKIELAVTSVRPEITAQVLRGGMLRSRKSLKIAGKPLAGPVLTDQDLHQIRLAKDYGVTALMQPFVTDAAQLKEVRQQLISSHGEHIRIFAKIENRLGMDKIRELLPEADMIVIARGDLGNDMPLWELPSAQHRLSEICRNEGKPFLVVTQMLASMVRHPYPTRAEVSDIFHAVLDGAAAVMVTNETAVGQYPIEAVRYLYRTVQEAERFLPRY
ncbi:MAG: pyruvate kinase [Eubacterium sp.]|nr:pyruvate kinase [Eubacterium sp.]